MMKGTNSEAKKNPTKVGLVSMMIFILYHKIIFVNRSFEKLNKSRGQTSNPGSDRYIVTMPPVNLVVGLLFTPSSQPQKVIHRLAYTNV